jgi:methylthioribose-1-phosphate isomerase
MKLVHSPLFEPVLWEGQGFKILDELLLPARIEFIRVDRLPEAIAAVKEMKTRAFGQVLTFLYSGALLGEQYPENDPTPLRDQLADMTQQFRAARPTFDFGGLGSFFSRWLTELPATVRPGAYLAKQARGLAEQIIKARLSRAKRTAELLPDSARVLTHCNISGELVAVAQLCKTMGKEISVIATETRPYLQGARLTAWELAQAGIAVSVIPDCAAAQVMSRGAVNAIVVGADRCAQNGDVINKVGTYPLALMAKEFGIPFYALVQDPGGLVQGEDVPIEERPSNELLSFQGEPLLAEGGDKLAGRYPAFDVTPAALITRLVGFDDLFTPESFKQRYFKGAVAPIANAMKSGEKYLLVFGLPRKADYSFLAHALKAEEAQRILIPEMRPQLWGARVVARELVKRQIPATLISDNMMGTLFAQGQIHRLYLFYRGLAEHGAAAICGSLLATRLARTHGVGIELLESEETKELPLDADVSTFLGRKVLPPKVGVYPIENELLPWVLLKPEKDERHDNPRT